jgi:hypothetical protein
MNDPIVEALFYKLKLSNEISFKNAPSLETAFSSFCLKLNGDILKVIMKEYCPTEIQARLIVEPYLRSWELDDFLTKGNKEFWFEFDHSEITERNPPKEGSTDLQVHCIECLTLIDNITIHVVRSSFPKPPFKLCFSPDVESLSSRYQGFIKGKEPLLSMAYFCYSLLCDPAGGYKIATRKYHINKKILKKLSELSSNRGDAAEARKMSKTSTHSISEPEKAWIKECLKLLIRRKAEYDFDPNSDLPIIDFNDLPIY